MKGVISIKKYYCYYNSADGKYYVESDYSSKKPSRKKKPCCVTINYYTNIAYEGGQIALNGGQNANQEGQIAGKYGRNKLIEFNFTNDNEE
ncbi:hypothetical protein Q4S57_09895 [Priestia megaterium]|uniref:hypothetical protein n=1 Tax=Priestia megaterium TaxID=1404 RepID=UPI0026E278E0|nr:hypothetical protein [Priestia megaterium]MDO6848260.1 hypothetical protein [Priestia megaterium]